MSGALTGIRVIDFGQYVAGPLTAMMLADNGAEVIRIDPPGGPRWHSHANAILQRGKRSIVLDLKQETDRDVARRLIASADVVIENFRPGVMERLGLDPQAMTSANPRLIYCSIPGFASDDPRASQPAPEGVVESATGIYMSSSFDVEGDPVYNPMPLSSTFASFTAGISIAAALIARHRCGKGQRIEVPLFDATFEDIGLAGDRFPDRPPTRRDNAGHRFAMTGHFACADGRFVHLSWLEGRQLRPFVERFGAPEWVAEGLADEEQVRGNPELNAELKRRLAAVFKTRTAAEWAQIANPASDLAECLTTEEWLNTEAQARITRAVITLDDPELGTTQQAGYAITMSKTPSEAQGPRHLPDADRAKILAELVQTEAAAARTDGVGGSILSRALEGFRVVDVTQVLAGPTCGRILAEHGADVIKIYNPFGRSFAGYHHYVNTGKRMVLLDLKQPEGKEVFDRLIEKSDVFSMNFSPPASARLGVTYDDVRAHKSDIVYSAISCYGWSGPRGTHRGHEQLGEAVTGMQVRWGEGFGEPVMQHTPICDYGTGNLAAFAIMLALYHRLRTGEGQYVEASLSQTATYHQIPFMIDYAGRVWNEPGGQEAKGWGPLYRLYRAADRWFFLGVLGDKREALRRLGAVEGLMGIETVGDAALEAELTARFASGSAADWSVRLNAAGIGAHVLRTIQENMEDPWVKSHHLSIERDYEGLGRIRTVGPAPRLSLTPVRVNAAAAPAGKHSRDMVDEVGLGKRYAAMLDAGIVSEQFPAPVRAAV